MLLSGCSWRFKARLRKLHITHLVDFPTSHTSVFLLSTLIIDAMSDATFPSLTHVFSEMLINIPLSPVQLAPRRRGACRSC